jgi:hypothetical protein
MAKRQFRSDDTLPWSEQYSNGAAGDQTYSSDKTLDSSDGAYWGTLTASFGDSFGNTDLADGTYNLPCKVIQEVDPGATDDPNWEYNVLLSVSGGVATFRYPLTRVYTTGAQFITSNPWKKLIINANITAPAWNGSKYGRVVLFASESITGSGSVHANNIGFRQGGSSGTSGNPAFQGESFDGHYQIRALSPTDGGGGGGGEALEGAGGGAGASYGTLGADGGPGGFGSGNTGRHGNTYGNASLTTCNLGSAGGGGGPCITTGNVGQPATNGGGGIDLVAPTINIAVHTNSNGIGSPGSNKEGSAGTGSGGSILAKGVNVTLSSWTATAGAAAGGPSNNSNGYGGTGGKGRIHVDYALTVSGSADPTADTRQDPTLIPIAGGAALYY